LEHAISADFFISVSLTLIAYCLSFATGVAMWAWGDDIMGVESLTPDDWQFGFWFFFILFLILNWYPYMTIFIVCLMGDWEWLTDTTDGRSTPVLIGMFTAAICHVIFDYFAAIVLDGVDTMIMCYAIDKANGMVTGVTADYAGKDVVMQAMYVLIDEKKDALGLEKKGDVEAGGIPVARAAPADVPPIEVPIEAQGTVVNVEVPAGYKPGQQLLISAPDGRTANVTIPDGVAPGSSFQARM